MSQKQPWIILVRHGQAEMGFGKKDQDRLLTEKGKTDVSEKSERLLTLLKERCTKDHRINNPDLEELGQASRQGEMDEQIHLVSSDAERARETSEILSQTLALGLGRDIQIVWDKGVYRGDEKLVQEYEDTVGGQDVLIIVGHQPTLSLWLSQLCGELWGFHPGDMAICVRNPVGQQWRLMTTID